MNINPQPFFAWLFRLVRTHPIATRWLVGGGLAWVGLCFALGYRLPWFDRHPDWPAFPQLTNPRLVVEHIPDFDERYGHRFPAVRKRQGAQQRDFSDVYRANLRNVHSLGYQVTGNRFRPRFAIRWSGPNEVGRRGSPPTRIGFRQEGYEYLQLNLGDEIGCFRNPFRGEPNALIGFYQYNFPRSITDTLYLRHLNADWRIVYR